ncbi:hypothetical protein L3Q82_015390 [Scortum barcoo]|uniref:Uncharacterized protein n=1 Tax=Scortum barcoo TaxID=214431 RepID=A0ACB8VU66_9TELE|nr:hypothetical protein L3Q82_015390 [Scortum barcoo]
MKKVFDHPVQGQEAVKRLLDLRQGSQSVAAYSVDFDFSILAAASVYHDLAPRLQQSKGHLPSPSHRPYDCPIDLLPGASLPTSRLYNLSRPEREAMEKYISESLAAGLIRPSSSPLGAGFFFVEKKDKTLRPCIDFPTIFSKLDLRNAYHLVRIREGDEWKTAFNTPLGHFEYQRLNPRQACWALFLSRFEFTLTYRPGSHNTKPDALSRQFSLDTSPSEPASILPPSCIVGAASWDIETRVQEALKDHPAPNNCPKDRLFVPSNLRSLVLQWIHTSKFSLSPWHSSDPLPPSATLLVAQDGSRHPGIHQCLLCLCPWQILSPCSSWFPQTPSYSSPPLVSYCCGLRLWSPTIPRYGQLFAKHLVQLPACRSGYHPQSNGQTERANQSLRDRSPLRCCSRRTRLFPPSKPTSADAAESGAPLEPLWFVPSTRSQKSANKLRRPAPDYLPGQKVWLSSRVLPLQVPSRKLAPRYIGPYVLEKIINPSSVRLKLPPSLRIHPTFHVSLLKPFTPSELCPPALRLPSSPPAHRWTPSILG